MRLSTRTRYGMRAIVELAENYGKGPLQIKIIAQNQGISVKYLEQLMAMLKSAGFVRSTRGSKGGYTLAKAAKQIRLSDVFRTLEGPVITVDCLENESYCSRAADCAIKQVWGQVQTAITSTLQSITLQDVVNKLPKNKMSNYQI